MIRNEPFICIYIPSLKLPLVRIISLVACLTCQPVNSINVLWVFFLRSYFMNIHKNEFYKLFHESWLMTHENQFYKILYESRLIFHKHTKQAVIFSVLWRIINMNLYRIVFYGSWISWAWTHTYEDS
jgi:hypothetical protein